jgi:hypothetical protein
VSFHAFGYAFGIAEKPQAKGKYCFQIQMPWWPGMISPVVYDWPRIGFKWDGPDMILKANTNCESQITEDQIRRAEKCGLL